MKRKPKYVITRVQTVAMMWDHAKLVREACEAMERLFARNCLLFEVGALSDAEMGVVMEEVHPVLKARDELEMLDLEPEEREAAERYVRDFMRCPIGGE